MKKTFLLLVCCLKMSYTGKKEINDSEQKKIKYKTIVPLPNKIIHPINENLLIFPSSSYETPVLSKKSNERQLLERLDKIRKIKYEEEIKSRKYKSFNSEIISKKIIF